MSGVGRVPLAPGSREPSPAVSALTGFDPSREPFECFSQAGQYRAELSPTGGWIILAIGFHGDSAFVDWTDNREDAVRLARMHADMELPL